MRNVLTVLRGNNIPVLFKGDWDASSGLFPEGQSGFVYRTSVAGTVGSPPTSYSEGEYIIYNGTVWESLGSGGGSSGGGSSIREWDVTPTLSPATDPTASATVNGSYAGNVLTPSFYAGGGSGVPAASAQSFTQSKDLLDGAVRATINLVDFARISNEHVIHIGVTTHPANLESDLLSIGVGDGPPDVSPGALTSGTTFLGGLRFVSRTGPGEVSALPFYITDTNDAYTSSVDVPDFSADANIEVYLGTLDDQAEKQFVVTYLDPRTNTLVEYLGFGSDVTTKGLDTVYPFVAVVSSSDAVIAPTVGIDFSAGQKRLISSDYNTLVATTITQLDLDTLGRATGFEKFGTEASWTQVNALPVGVSDGDTLLVTVDPAFTGSVTDVRPLDQEVVLNDQFVFVTGGGTSYNVIEELDNYGGVWDVTPTYVPGSTTIPTAVSVSNGTWTAGTSTFVPDYTPTSGGIGIGTVIFDRTTNWDENTAVTVGFTTATPPGNTYSAVGWTTSPSTLEADLVALLTASPVTGKIVMAVLAGTGAPTTVNAVLTSNLSGSTAQLTANLVAPDNTGSVILYTGVTSTGNVVPLVGAKQGVLSDLSGFVPSGDPAPSSSGHLFIATISASDVIPDPIDVVIDWTGNHDASPTIAGTTAEVTYSLTQTDLDNAHTTPYSSVTTVPGRHEQVTTLPVDARLGRIYKTTYEFGDSATPLGIEVHEGAHVLVDSVSPPSLTVLKDPNAPVTINNRDISILVTPTASSDPADLEFNDLDEALDFAEDYVLSNNRPIEVALENGNTYTLTRTHNLDGINIKPQSLVVNDIQENVSDISNRPQITIAANLDRVFTLSSSEHIYYQNGSAIAGEALIKKFAGLRFGVGLAFSAPVLIEVTSTAVPFVSGTVNSIDISFEACRFDGNNAMEIISFPDVGATPTSGSYRINLSFNDCKVATDGTLYTVNIGDNGDGLTNVVTEVELTVTGLNAFNVNPLTVTGSTKKFILNVKDSEVASVPVIDVTGLTENIVLNVSNVGELGTLRLGDPSISPYTVDVTLERTSLGDTLTNIFKYSDGTTTHAGGYISIDGYTMSSQPGIYDEIQTMGWAPVSFRDNTDGTFVKYGTLDHFGTSRTLTDVLESLNDPWVNDCYHVVRTEGFTDIYSVGDRSNWFVGVGALQTLVDSISAGDLPNKVIYIYASTTSFILDLSNYTGGLLNIIGVPTLLLSASLNTKGMDDKVAGLRITGNVNGYADGKIAIGGSIALHNDSTSYSAFTNVVNLRLLHERRGEVHLSGSTQPLIAITGTYTWYIGSYFVKLGSNAISMSANGGLTIRNDSQAIYPLLDVKTYTTKYPGTIDLSATNAINAGAFALILTINTQWMSSYTDGFSPITPLVGNVTLNTTFIPLLLRSAVDLTSVNWNIVGIKASNSNSNSSGDLSDIPSVWVPNGSTSPDPTLTRLNAVVDIRDLEPWYLRALDAHPKLLFVYKSCIVSNLSPIDPTVLNQRFRFVDCTFESSGTIDMGTTDNGRCDSLIDVVYMKEQYSAPFSETGTAVTTSNGPFSDTTARYFMYPNARILSEHDGFLFEDSTSVDGMVMQFKYLEHGARLINRSPLDACVIHVEEGIKLSSAAALPLKYNNGIPTYYIVAPASARGSVSIPPQTNGAIVHVLYDDEEFVKEVTGTTYTVTGLDLYLGVTLVTTNASPVTITVPSGLVHLQRKLKIRQGGDGKVTLAESSTTIESPTGSLSLAGIYSEVELIGTPTTDTYKVVGELAEPEASIYMSGNATTTTVAATSTYYKVAGTTVANTLQDFTMTDNRVTYTGSRPRTFDVTVSLCLQVVDGQDEVRARIGIDGTTREESCAHIGVTGSAATTRKVSLVLVDRVTLSSGQYIEPFVGNWTAIDDILVINDHIRVTPVKR